MEVPTLRVAQVLVGDVDKIESVPIKRLLVTHEGLPGDRHQGYLKDAGVREKHLPGGQRVRNRRFFSAVSCEELTLIAEGLGIDQLEARWLGANILFEGYPFLTQLPPLTLLKFENGAILRVFEENTACIEAGRAIQQHYPDQDRLDARFVEVAEGLKKARATGQPRRGLRGIVGDVECTNVIDVGEKAQIIVHRYFQERGLWPG